MKKSKHRPKCKILYWHQIDWKTAEKTVYTLQRRIYQASSRDKSK
ncbi:MAG: reverse transcriptase N-terminal domain-containing protein [Prochloraceae cyanobacterium]|nr:reverse transcriptase N-terminal domain-containing protein [Prochloraceae cyanobacterium]